MGTDEVFFRGGGIPGFSEEPGAEVEALFRGGQDPLLVSFKE